MAETTTATDSLTTHVIQAAQAAQTAMSVTQASRAIQLSKSPIVTLTEVFYAGTEGRSPLADRLAQLAL